MEKANYLCTPSGSQCALRGGDVWKNVEEPFPNLPYWSGRVQAKSYANQISSASYSRSMARAAAIPTTTTYLV